MIVVSVGPEAEKHEPWAAPPSSPPLPPRLARQRPSIVDLEASPERTRGRRYRALEASENRHLPKLDVNRRLPVPAVAELRVQRQRANPVGSEPLGPAAVMQGDEVPVIAHQR